MRCPKCKEECDREEVDVGVGVISGPWCCNSCGWSEDDDSNIEGGFIDIPGRFENGVVVPRK